MTAPELRVTAEPDPGLPDAPGVTVRVVNGGDTPVELLNPDVGRPLPASHWPFSVETYRAATLISYGYLALRVHDAGGEPVEPLTVATWSTPVLRAPVALGPGDSCAVPVPLGQFFALTPGERYTVAVDFGDAALRVHAETELVV
jgi:hypothetical protein